MDPRRILLTRDEHGLAHKSVNLVSKVFSLFITFPPRRPPCSRRDGSIIYSVCCYYWFAHFDGLRGAWESNHQTSLFLMDCVSAAKTVLPSPHMSVMYPQINRRFPSKILNPYQNPKYQPTFQLQILMVITHSRQFHWSSGKRLVQWRSTMSARKTSTVG